MLLILFTLSYFFQSTCGIEPKEIVIVILTQENEFNLKQAESLKSDIIAQTEKLQNHPVIHFSHVDFPHVGHWTILPIITELEDIHGNNGSWFLILEERTHVDIIHLLTTLNKYNSNEELWIGHRLHDQEATVIHHFAFYENPKAFVYPCVICGFAISSALMQRLADRLEDDAYTFPDFNIDSAFELALFIWDEGKGPLLTHESALCSVKGQGCATYPEDLPNCGQHVPQDAVYFAVKTCSKFHNDRVPVIKNTWGVYAQSLAFFSDKEDATIPTISVGIPNTERGHCGKTIALMKYIMHNTKHLHNIHWVVVADDDTLFSVSRLLHLLACYNTSRPIALGERYGYEVHEFHGFNYLTGGSGMVFSKPLLDEIINHKECECRHIDSPDDMHLGVCIRSLGRDVLHSAQFHQARPMDYAPELLKMTPPISFHKYWMLDPIEIYNKWFREEDYKLKMQTHTEL